MKYRIVEREEIKITGESKEITCNVEEGTQAIGIAAFWGELNANETVNRLVQLMNGDIKGPLGVTNNFDEEKNTIEYWIGVENQGEIQNEFSTIELPPAKWVVFEVRGPVSTAIPEAWKQIYSESFPDRKSTRLNSSHVAISYAVFCLKK